MPIHSSAADILARFPGPVTLYPSRKKWLLVLASCLLFVVTSPWMIRADPWMGWVGLILFGVGALIAGTIVLLPSLGRLTLDHEGFEAGKRFFRYRRRWGRCKWIRSVDVWAMVHDGRL
jgi:hypothetical protein